MATRAPKLPADPNRRAFNVVQIATGEAEPVKFVPGRRAGGLAGGKARAESLTPAQRKKIAKKAAEARWNTPK